MTGRVVSTKLKNSATVLVERMAMHPLYKKTYVRSKRFLVDDSIGVKMGDIVDIIKCRPISKNKHWKITKVLGRNFAEIAEEKLKKEAEGVIAEAVPAGRQVMPEEKGSEQGTVDSEQSEGIKEKPVKKGRTSSKKEKGSKE